jgi:glycosyltransferase involved in cell wall biosynthesis
MDGGSKDNTNEIIDSYGDKIAVHISEPDKGIYDAWNKGVGHTSGKWVGFIGADDVLLPNAVSSFLQTIMSTTDIDSYDYICAHNEYADKEGNVIQVIGAPAVWSKMRRGMVAAHVASLHNKHNLFETIGGYDLQFHICADYDLLLRKRDKLKSLFVDSTIARMQTGGMSFSTAAIKEAYKIRRKNLSINIIENKLIFLWNLLAFKTYNLRHRV